MPWRASWSGWRRRTRAAGRRSTTRCATSSSIRLRDRAARRRRPHRLHAAARGDADLPESHRLQRAVPGERARRVQRAGRTLRAAEDRRSRQADARRGGAVGARGCACVWGSFEPVAEIAAPGDFVYFDPPYAPLSRTANFTSLHRRRASTPRISSGCSSWCIVLAARGCHVLLSNSTADEIAALYERNADARAAGLRAIRVPARRAINSNAARRGPVEEYPDHQRAGQPQELAPTDRWRRVTSERVRTAKVAELADAPDLGSGSRKAMGVRVPPFALLRSRAAARTGRRAGLSVVSGTACRLVRPR